MSLMVGKNSLEHLSMAIFSHRHLVVRLTRNSLSGTNALAYFICNIIDKMKTIILTQYDVPYGWE